MFVGPATLDVFCWCLSFVQVTQQLWMQEDTSSGYCVSTEQYATQKNKTWKNRIVASNLEGTIIMQHT